MKSYLNSDLLLELIITNSPTAPCSHVFIAAKLNDNEHKNDKSRNRFICKYCLTHLFITGTESSRCKNHMFLTDASNDLSHIHSVCVHCQLSFQIATQLRQFPENLLSDLLFRKDVESQIYCLFMLIFYFGAIYNGASKPINSKNPKFLQYIGTGQVPIDALGLIGYSLDAQGYFQPSKVASADRDKIECIIEELSLIRTTFKGDSKDSIVSFLEATEFLCKLLDVNYDGSNSEMFLRAFRDELRHLPTAYRLLGCSRASLETSIMTMYRKMAEMNPSNIPDYLDSLMYIANEKRSSVMEDLVAMEKSKGIVGKKELTDAYTMLGDTINDDTSARRVVEIYRYACITKPSKISEIKQALITIANFRDCPLIHHYLRTGELPAYNEHDNRDCVNLPAGLTNIGNTCYLNSLLQYYFSINPLRDFVLRFGEVDLGVAQAKIEDRKVRSQYCKTKLEFTIVVLQLQNLFIELIKSNDMEVKPSRTLAEVLLKANSSGVFGEQQDIHECMDSFLDMIQIMVDQSNLELDLNKLFFGRTKQTLAYKDPDGVEKLLLKEETFHQIIVNVFPCLYDALDEYFGDQTVDFERGKALKCLGVLEFPTALAIRINRVVYDRDTQKVVKTNHYLKYPKKLYMDRYMYVNANETKQKQLHIKAIDTEIKGLKIALDELQNQLNVCNASLLNSDIIRNDINETMLKITSLTNSKLQMFEDMNTEEYMLYGAFFHQGDANFGHYWQFLYDVHQKRWLKFNDSLVTEVPESQVFEDTTGKTYNTYTLIYIKSGQLETLTRPMVRTEELRKYYFNSGNK
ncbi:hypothetical protein BC833DRAFT_647586 [Globomyces pollinis-pini]|nr:hypothetical protein BC833DRAFT_647586 [Globomyces pollinis-pini]